LTPLAAYRFPYFAALPIPGLLEKCMPFELLEEAFFEDEPLERSKCRLDTALVDDNRQRAAAELRATVSLVRVDSCAVHWLVHQLRSNLSCCVVQPWALRVRRFTPRGAGGSRRAPRAAPRLFSA
jgi:hypothetical protein